MSERELLVIGDRVHHPVRGMGNVTYIWVDGAEGYCAYSVRFDSEPARLFIYGESHIAKVGS